MNVISSVSYVNSISFAPKQDFEVENKWATYNSTHSVEPASPFKVERCSNINADNVWTVLFMSGQRQQVNQSPSFYLN